MNALTMGARSIGRNRRRTFTTVFAMAFAGVFCIFYGGLISGMMASLEHNALRMDLGEIQVHHPGYRSDPSLYDRVEGSDAIVETLEKQGFAVTSRRFAYGLAAGNMTSAGVQVRGLDVAREARVTSIAQHLAAGSWLDASDPDGVVLGGRLAKLLRVAVGDSVVLLGQGADGGMANALFRVRGVLRPASESIDRGGVLMSAEAFAGLFTLDGGAHELVVVRPPGSELSLEQAADRVRAAAPGEETMTWRTLQPVLADMLGTSRGAQIFMMVVIYAAIAMVILNATLMSVFERIREFGVMKALGVRPGQVAAIIYVEVVAQAVIAALIAVAVGAPLTWYAGVHGIDLSGLMQNVSVQGVAFDPVWRTVIDVPTVVVPVVVLVVVSLLSALYPGIKAAVISPVEAIHHQ